MGPPVLGGGQSGHHQVNFFFRLRVGKELHDKLTLRTLLEYFFLLNDVCDLFRLRHVRFG